MCVEQCLRLIECGFPIESTGASTASGFYFITHYKNP